MEKIFIAGVPATGKTTIGEYLREKFNFRHFDVEGDEANPNLNSLGMLFWSLEIDKLLGQFGDNKNGIVITWGFVCDDQRSLAIIDMLQARGFKFVWFNAEEQIARAKFLERGTGDVRDFDIQMERIKRLDLNRFIKPIIITTLDKNRCKNKDEIIEEIFKH